MSIIAWDYDGVLTDCTERYAKLNEGRYRMVSSTESDYVPVHEENPDWVPDWDTFHGPSMDEELPHMEYVVLARLLAAAGHQNVIVTNRITTFRERTIAHARKHDIPFVALRMREPGQDFATAKGLHLDSLIDIGHIGMGFDDDPAERETYEIRGIPFFYVDRGHHSGEITRNGGKKNSYNSITHA